MVIVPAALFMITLVRPVPACGRDARIYENREQGFQIRVPQGWKAVPEQADGRFRFSASARGNSPLFTDPQPGPPFPALPVDDDNRRMVFREYTGVIEGETFRTYAGYSAKGTRGYVAIAYFPDGDSGLERRARGRLLSFKLVEAPPLSSSREGYRTLREDRFGFILDIPRDWTHRLTEDRDYLISGPAGAPASEVRVILQFISKSQNPGSSAAAQLAEARRQLTGGGARIDREGNIDVAGGSSPFLIAALDAADSRGVSVPHGYILVILDHGDHYLWITYSGPAEEYEAFGPEFQKMLDSFRFLR